MRKLQDNNNNLVEKVGIVIMFLITIMLIIIETIKISVVINTKVIAINLNSSPETRMESPCAMPAVFITNYTT